MKRSGRSNSSRANHGRRDLSGSQIKDFSGLGSSKGRRVTRGINSRSYHSKGGSKSSWDETAFDNGKILLTRRQLLYGAIGVGAVAAVGVGAKVVSSKMKESSEVNVLSVPTSLVTESTDLTEIDNYAIGLYAEMKLPYGTLIWANEDDYAAMLLPTSTGSPLTKIGLMHLSSGYYDVVLEKAVGIREGFEIYDVRASSQGLVWTEVDIIEGIWRIYATSQSDGSIDEPLLLDQGDSDWETPSIAICGDKVFWQILPQKNGPKSTEQSVIKKVSIGLAAPEIVMTSNGRFCTPLYAMNDSIVATPRAETDNVNYQLTVLNAHTDAIEDTMVLPSSMRPLEAGYGKTGFMFSFEGIYSYGDGIANMGTYAPMTDTRKTDPSNTPWFHFSRTPSAAPCWCGDRLIVKSTRSVCCIDLVEQEYFLLEAVNGSDNYGDYLASTGNCNRIVTFANINEQPIDGAATKYCLARIWSC